MKMIQHAFILLIIFLMILDIKGLDDRQRHHHQLSESWYQREISRRLEVDRTQIHQLASEISVAATTESPSTAPTEAPTKYQPTSMPSSQKDWSTAPISTLPPTKEYSYSQSPTVNIEMTPSVAPSRFVSTSPTISPSRESPPTSSPVMSDSIPSTYSPTMAPTASPTISPSIPSFFIAVDTAFPTSATPTMAPTEQPIIPPSCSPSAVPTESPSASPSVYPTLHPTVSPTLIPSSAPSTEPTIIPTASPSVQHSTIVPTQPPTESPTGAPTANPSPIPTETPSTSPTSEPSHVPTNSPTALPTVHPTASPTTCPSEVPSAFPTEIPTHFPTAAPSVPPTIFPTETSTEAPSMLPSELPSVLPSVVPSENPTFVITMTPTQHPSETPSSEPTATPSDIPSEQPTFLPTVSPSFAPTASPSSAPSVAPSIQPSTAPTAVPTTYPSYYPTIGPSELPTVSSSEIPTVFRSDVPTVSPSAAPTTSPTSSPTTAPTMNPTTSPTTAPTCSPSASPTTIPSTHPTNIEAHALPTVEPSERPTVQPTLNPSTFPTARPTQMPTISPTESPTIAPTEKPTSSPTISPTTCPTYFPSELPTVLPSTVPTPDPTLFPSMQPSSEPTEFPSPDPSNPPTVLPMTTVGPSVAPTDEPSAVPTPVPSIQPTTHPSLDPSVAPTVSPSTDSPSTIPSTSPSEVPTIMPTFPPSVSPTATPSNPPTESPSGAPTTSPTYSPTEFPTVSLSQSPSSDPTWNPSGVPSIHPSINPSVEPSETPTMSPSIFPTEHPSEVPSINPSAFPSIAPSTTPSSAPTAPLTTNPTVAPTSEPSAVPSANPTIGPTVAPSSSFVPTDVPTLAPTSLPTLSPTIAPTSISTENPTVAPSIVMTNEPSVVPSDAPTLFPVVVIKSIAPTEFPTDEPSISPSGAPSVNPTVLPSESPTVSPTMVPTLLPSKHPTPYPTEVPTHAPTVEVKVTSSPTEEITTYPTLTPSMAPSLSPTASPTLGSTLSPSVSPTIVSTLIPSANPSTNPTMVPSFSPSVQVTVAPTINPTRVPTNTLSPTLIPTTSVPSLLPSVNPTVAPTTPLPTVQPTKQPISQPSGQPSRQPTGQPTRQPTRQPTSQPSRQPSRQPTGQPTRQPTGQPTRQPSSQPTFQPSNQPTGQPSGQPSFQPSGQPTCQPNSLPTSQPTSEPSGFPTSLPTGVPSSIPSMVPTAIPSGLPTAMPTAYPSTSPSCRPSGSPTTHPSRVPSSSPSVPPTSIPTSRPTSRPTSLPSLVPTSRPSPKPSPAPSVIPTVSPTTAPSRYASILPVIASITASPGISNATVSVHFSSTGTPSGNIFCVATTTVIQSTSTVTGSGYFASYTSETKSVAVVIKGLVAAKNYTVYCVARNIDGSISSLPQVLQLGQKFMTQCCRSISISSSPSYLLNNPTLYWSNKVSATNVFKYSLGSPPDNLITIKPYLVYFNGSRVASAFWSSSPSIMMIYSNNATSDCSFSLVVFSSVASGSYRLLMDLTTPGAIRQYSTPSLTVKVVDVSSTASILLPPPSLSSVVFSDNGALVYISFESATNRASISDSQWTCSRVFSFLGDSQATCTWINSTVVEASLNREASSTSSNRRLAGTSTLAVGGSITVLPGKIAAECPSTSFFYVNCSAFMYLTTAIPITASTPSNPVKPTPIIVVPSKIQRCTDFTIDPSLSYGNGGQSFVAVIWTVKREGITVSSLQNALNNLGFAPLNVPSTFGLTDGTYYVTLSLTNIFGEKQEATISFYYGAALYSPTIEILGSKSREIKFGDSLMIYSKVSVPVSSCSGVNSANLTQLVISWKIFKREVDIITGSTHLQPTTVTSISNNPRTFHLAGYGFPGEGDYVVKIIASATTTDKWSLVNATSSVEVAVYGGDVIAAISGGATRSIVADTELDASGSYDQRNNVTELSFKWTCSILSGALYGSSCDEIFENMLGSTLSKAKVMLSKLLNGISYQVYVTVTASDGRVGGTSITVVKGDSSYGEYILEIANTATEFNGEDNLAIYGYVGAVNNFTAVWTASTPTSNNIALSNTYTATALVRNFTLPSYSGYTKIPFPISVAPFVLSSYSKVTFRLSLYGIGTYEDSESSPFAYSEITLKVNSAPYGGTVLISPGSGSAFKTQFNIETAGWVDGDADQSLPLTFDYRYRRVSTSSWLTIQQRSTQMHASSLLPSGTSEDGYRLTVIVRAFDSLLASSNVTSTAIVSSTAGFDYLGYLNSQESSSSDDQADVNQQYVIANNVLTMFNGVDCSMAPPSQCALMNRYNCSLVSNMCGDCLDGYYGDAGAANTPCFKYNATAKSTGASCKSDDECQYGKCLNHTCSLPLKTCPADCSGRGHCIYAVNGASVESKDCAVSNPYCVAKCSCDEGYGGFACEFTSEEAFARSSIISVVCATLQQVLLNSDPSPQFLESMTSSIFLSSSSSATAGDADTPVITSIDDSCIALFESLSEIVKEGYLNGTSHVEDTSLQLISSLSNFASAIEVQYSTLSEIVNIDKSLLALSSLLEDILANLIQGMFTAMVTGESNKEYVTDNLMMSLYRDYIDPMKTTVSLKPPQSSQEIAFEKVSPSISFVGDSFRYCDAGNGYVKTSVVKWVSSPFPNTTNIDSPLFRSEAYVDPANNNFPTVDVNKPVFYIILPFTTTQNIMNNNSISGSIADIISTSNYTITQPKCFTYNSSLVSGSEYFMCNNCNISSYTNETVTFECYDISMICGVSATDSTANKRYRNLLSLTGDDDGFGSTGSQPKSQQIAAILSSVVVEIETVISTNPFSINYEKSKVVVSFVGALCLVIIFGMLFFNNWDWRDHHKLVYAHGSGDFFGKPAVAQSVSKHGFEDDEGEVEYDVVEEKGINNNDEGVVRKSKMDGSQHSAEKNSNNNFGYKKSKSIKRSRETKLLQDALLNAERFDGNDEDDDDESNSDEPAPHTNDGFASKIPNPMDGNEMEVIKNFLDLAIPLRMNKLDEKSKKNRVKSIDLNANYRSSVGSVSLASSNISYSQKSTSFWLSMSAFWKTYWKTVWNHHLLTRMLGEASLSHTRLIRWVHLVMMILLMLFVDTLFFGIFFPDEGFCESQQTKADCLSSVSSVTNDYLCVWEESVSWGSLNTYNYAPTQTAQASVSCSIASPPNTLSFIFILAVCTIIVALPLTVFYEYILMEICSKRPDLSLYGFYTARYFGSELTDVQEHRVDISEFEKMFFGNHGYDNADFFDLTEEEFFARVEEVTRSYFDSPQGYTLQEQDYITRMIYANCMTTEAETDLLLREVRHYIIRHVFRAQVPWSYVASLNSTAKSAQTPRQSHDSAENEFPRASSPNRVSFAQSTVDRNSPSASRTPSQSIPPPVWKTSASTEEKLKVMQELLGMYVDTTPRPMTMLDRIWYGDRRKRLELKIQSARRKALSIESKLWSIPDLSGFERSICLIRYFLLEMFSPFKQFVIKFQYFPFQSFSKETISLKLWLFGWVVILGSMVFFLYWILAWGVSSGSTTFANWGWNFLLVVIQEIIFIQLAHIYVIYFVAMFSIEPQLISIYHCLHNIAIDIVNNTKERVEKEEQQMRLMMQQQQELLAQQEQQILLFQQQGMHDPGSTSPVSEVPVIVNPQQFSPGVTRGRASPLVITNNSPVSPSKSTSSTSFPTSPQVTNQSSNLSLAAARAAQAFEDTSVVQYLSPACRVANRSVMKDLPAAKILRHFLDSDLIICKQSSNKQLYLITFLFIGIPVIFSTVISEQFGIMVLDAILPSGLYLYIVANYYLYEVSVYLLIAVYILIVFIYFYRQWVYKPAIERWERQRFARRHATDLPDAVDSDSKISEYDSDRLKHQNSVLSLRRCFNRTSSSNEKRNTSCVSKVIFVVCATFALTWALLRFIWTSIQYCIVIAPYEWYRFMFWSKSDLRYDSRSRAIQFWRRMNIPTILQGMEVSLEDYGHYREQLLSASTGMVIPPQIQELRVQVKNPMTSGEGQPPTKSAAATNGWSTHYEEGYNDVLSRILSLELLSNPQRENPLENLMWLREASSANMLQNGDNKGQVRQATIIAPTMELHDIVVDLKISSIDKNMSLNDGALLIDDTAGSKRVSARFSHRVGNEVPAPPAEEPQPEDYSYTDVPRQAWNFMVYSRFGLDIPTELTVTEAKEILIELLRIYRPCHLPIDEEDQEKVIHRFERRLPKDEHISPDMMTLNTERFELWFLGQAKSLRNKMASENDVGVSSGGGGNVGLPPLVI